MNDKKFSLEEISNDQCVTDFIDSREIKEGTKKAYIQRIKRYCNVINKSPIELVEEAEEEQDNSIKSRKRKIKSYLISYKKYLESIGTTPMASRSNMTTVKSFYQAFDIEVPRLKIKQLNENVSLEDTISFEDIKQIVSSAPLRDKAIIMLMLSSGMGAGELKALNYGDFVKSFQDYIKLSKNDLFDVEFIYGKLKDRDDLIGTWNITRIKTGMPYYTFNSPESSKSILDYLLERDRMNSYPTDLDEPLFISREKNRLSSMGFIYIFQRLNDKLGLGHRNKFRHTFTSHQLRKLFSTTLYSNGVDKVVVDWLLGHRINQQTEAYFKTNEKDLKNRYTNEVQHLSLEKVKVKEIRTKEFDDLLRKMGKQEEETKRKLDEKDTELNKITDAFSKVAELLLKEQKEESEETRIELMNALEEVKSLKK
jgi:integrase